MIHILDLDLREKLFKIEGDSEFYRYCLDNEESLYSLASCIKHYKENVLVPNTFDDDQDKDQHEYYLNHILYFGPIYGSGGMNRYPVYGTGEVCISKFHSSDRAIKLAIKLGFGVR